MKRLTKIILLLSVLLNWSCAGNPAARQSAKPSTSQSAAAAERAVTSVRAGLGGAKKTVSDMTPDNLNSLKPLALEQIERADRDAAEAQKELQNTKAGAVANAKENERLEKKVADLQASDPVRRGLEWTGYGGILLGIACLVGSFWLSPLAGGHVRAGGCAALAVGLSAATLAHFLTQIYIALAIVAGVVFLAALVWLAVYAWRRRAMLGEVVKSIDAGRTRGNSQLVNLDDVKQSPLTKAIVKAITKPTLAGGG